MKSSEIKTIDEKRVPIIDIEKIKNDGFKKKIAKELFKASTDLGFIYIKNHSIPKKLINNLRIDGFNFFRSPVHHKDEISISDKHRGWLGFGGAKMGDKAKPDLKESFIWGYQYSDGSLPDNHQLRGANKWPDFIPSLKKNSLDYFESVNELAKDLLSCFALGLNLDEDFFIRSCSAPLSRASLVYYPNQPKEMGEMQFGVSEHTDFGLLTILCQDSVGGLQIKGLDGEWFYAPPIEGTLIVNVADLLSRWTGGIYKSTPHRVVNSSGKERLSIVMAFDPDPDTLIDSSEIKKIKKTKYEDPITCGDYLIWRFNKAFSYRKR
ncbi:MAG: isopenicillin N synthase family dioxygenase [Paracoccaceae bacterium]